MIITFPHLAFSWLIFFNLLVYYFPFELACYWFLNTHNWKIIFTGSMHGINCLHWCHFIGQEQMLRSPSFSFRPSALTAWFSVYGLQTIPPQSQGGGLLWWLIILSAWAIHQHHPTVTSVEIMWKRPRITAPNFDLQNMKLLFLYQVLGEFAMQQYMKWSLLLFSC